MEYKDIKNFKLSEVSPEMISYRPKIASGDVFIRCSFILYGNKIHCATKIKSNGYIIIDEFLWMDHERELFRKKLANAINDKYGEIPAFTKETIDIFLGKHLYQKNSKRSHAL